MRSALTRLADAAAAAARTLQGDVAVVRGDGFETRHQSRLLRAKIHKRRARAYDVAPAEVPDTAHRRAAGLAVVVDLTEPDVWDAHRLAAHLAAPLFALDDPETAGTGNHPYRPGGPRVVERDAVWLAASRYEDIALSRALIAPCDHEPATIRLSLANHEPVELTDAEIDVRLGDRCLEITARIPGQLDRHFRGPSCSLQVEVGRFILLRDGTPTADLRGSLTLSVLSRPVIIHTITRR